MNRRQLLFGAVAAMVAPAVAKAAPAYATGDLVTMTVTPGQWMRMPGADMYVVNADRSLRGISFGEWIEVQPDHVQETARRVLRAAWAPSSTYEPGDEVMSKGRMYVAEE